MMIFQMIMIGLHEAAGDEKSGTLTVRTMQLGQPGRFHCNNEDGESIIILIA